MQRSAVKEDRKLSEPAAKSQSNVKSKMVELWKGKARKLADLVLKQEMQKRELQKEVEVLRDAQTISTDAKDLAQLRAELLTAKDKLLKQATTLVAREELLKEAAGAARSEILQLQQINRDLRAEVEHLILENKELAEKAKMTAANSATKGTIAAVYPSPGKALHMDTATLQSMLSQKDDELVVLREDNGVKQEELLHSLQSLQQAHKRSEELRCQTVSLNNQIEILREALRQKDCDVDDILGDMEQLKSLQDSLEIRDQECIKLHEILAESAQQMAIMRSELQITMDESSVLKSTLRERDVQVQELQAKAENLQLRLSLVQEKLDIDDLASQSSIPSVDDAVYAAPVRRMLDDMFDGEEDINTGYHVAPENTLTAAKAVEDTAQSPAQRERRNHGRKVAHVFAHTFVLARLIVAVACIAEGLLKRK